MNYQEVVDFLASVSDEKYKLFNEKLIPDIGFNYGVRLPVLRKIATKIAKQQNANETLDKLALGQSYEEKMLHGFIVAKLQYKSTQELYEAIERQILLIDNWALCDSFVSSLRGQVTKEKSAFLQQINVWAELTQNPWQIRFVLVMLNSFYANKEYLDEVFAIVRSTKFNHYYVNMAAAWLLSTVYFSDKEKVSDFLARARISDWVINKAIQKIIESKKVNPKEKQEIKKLKRKG